MKLLNRFGLLSLLVTLAFFLNGCEAIAGIFKAGVWVGVLIVVAIIGLIIYLFSRGRK